MEYLENRTFDEIQVGDSATLTRTLTEQDIMLFAVMSGDINPAHVDAEYAKNSQFREVIGHGMWSGALISTVLGTQFPGPGTIYLGQDLRFRHPVGVGDMVTVKVTATARDVEKGRLTLETECVNQDGKVVVSGTAHVIAPREKVRRPRIDLPDVRIDDRETRFRQIAARVKGRKLEPVPTAVAHPCDTESLAGALQAGREGVIVPVLVGPEGKLRETARVAELDLTGVTIVPVAHSHEAAAVAVRLAREGTVEAIMKGSLQTAELIEAVIARDSGLRTERRLSHVFAMDVPTYPKPLFITDAAINIEPTLEEKRDIVQNAIDLGTLTRKSNAPGGATGGRGDRQPQDASHDRRRGAVQDDRSRSDHRCSARGAARLRQRNLPRCGAREAHSFPSGGTGRHPGGARYRIGQHARQAAHLSRGCARCRHRARRARTDCTSQSF